MAIGMSIFFIAVGAILTFAVEVPVTGLDLDVVGVILMSLGTVGLLLSLVWWSDAMPWRRDHTVIHERYVEPTDLRADEPPADLGRHVIERERRTYRAS